MSEQVYAWTFQGGDLKQVVTSVVLVNATAKTLDTVVPTGKRWKLLGVKAINGDDVTRDINVFIYKEPAKTNVLRKLIRIDAVLANGGVCQWPNYHVTTTATTGCNALHQPAEVILAAGNVISVVWATGGASTGATDTDGLVIEYLEIDEP